MNVFTYFSPDGPDLEAQLVPLWEESWRRQGWTPRVLTIRDAKKHPRFKAYPCLGTLALSTVGGGWFSPLHLINFSFRPRNVKRVIETWPHIRLFCGTKRLLNESIEAFPNVFSKIKVQTTLTEDLISFRECATVEEVQRGIDSCLQARKKN